LWHAAALYRIVEAARHVLNDFLRVHANAFL
jgi:hypothetical protein